MSKKINRNIYRTAIIITFLAVNALILTGIASVLRYLSTGADRTTILHLREEADLVYLPKIEWENLDNPGRPMEKQTLGEIQRDYLKSWYVRFNAYNTNNNYGIPDYYTDSARVKLYRNVALNKEHNVTLNKTTIKHHPALDFYSADGKLVVFTDQNVLSYQEVYRNKLLVNKERTVGSYKVLMLLEDGFWRVRHLVEIPSEEKIPILEKSTINDSQEKLISEAKGLNYYPKDMPWDMFGDNFDMEVLQKDFKLIKEMGLNTLRIFIQYEDFGAAMVQPEKLQKLRQTLDLMEKMELQAVVTLFDFYGNYEVNDWTLTHRHAEQIVTAFKDHQAIFAWDIKNEPDLDFKSRGKEKVLSWLEEMIINLKKWDPNHMVTIGWSTPEAAVNLGDELDFISFHYYRDIADFLPAYKELKEAHPTKKIMLQEYGASSYSGVWNMFSSSPKKQAQYYEQMQKILEEEELPFLFWTLYDFTDVPNSVVGRLPWHKSKQKHFGCIDSDGKRKLAYKFLYQK